MNRRGQASIEFMVLIGFVLLSFVIFMLIIQESTEDRRENRQNSQIKEIALSVRNEIELASASEDGYVREFSLPENAYGGDYNIRINESIVFVESVDGDHALSMTVRNVTGQIWKYDNEIRKENGEVKLNS
jgi:hypothetical protein